MSNIENMHRQMASNVSETIKGFIKQLAGNENPKEAEMALQLVSILESQALRNQAMNSNSTAPLASPKPQKRHMSASARKRIADAQRRRWAKVNQEKEREAKRVKGSPAYEAQRAIKKGRRRV